MPRWVLFGVFVLAFIAGMINVVGFLDIEHRALSHFTGTSTLLSISVAQSDFSTFLHLATIILSFLFGCILSGYIIQDTSLKLGRRYDVVLCIESVLLVAAVPLLTRNLDLGNNLAACACGLQNAMTSSYGGFGLRNTQLTGMLTDAGILIGHFLRRVPVDFWRFALYCAIILGFILGGLLGALLFPKMGYNVLYIPAASTFLIGFTYLCYRKLKLSKHETPQR